MSQPPKPRNNDGCATRRANSRRRHRTPEHRHSGACEKGEPRRAPRSPTAFAARSAIRCGPTGAHATSLLVSCAIAGAGSMSDVGAHLSSPDGPICRPYVGPRPFERDDEGLFFGRGREVADAHESVLVCDRRDQKANAIYVDREPTLLFGAIDLTDEWYRTALAAAHFGIRAASQKHNEPRNAPRMRRDDRQHMPVTPICSGYGALRAGNPNLAHCLVLNHLRCAVLSGSQHSQRFGM